AALTHRSFAFEQGVAPTNERLEFLGDAVLGLCITELAYRAFPELSEGELAKLRAAMVNMTMLADVARQLQLGEAVLLGRGKEFTATVYLAGREYGRGTGRSKKEAEQRAAREAHARLTEGVEMAKEH